MVKYLERHCAFPGTPRGGGCHVEESKALPGRCLPSPHVSFRLDQKTANFKVATESRPNQWSVSTEGKQKKSTCANRVSLQKNNNNNSVRRVNYWKFSASILALHCSKKRQTSSWPRPAAQCKGVDRRSSLNKSKGINLRNQSFAS